MAVKTKASKAATKVATGYCFGCRVERQMNEDSYVEQLLTGQKVLRGTCIKCGKGMGKIVSKETPVDKYQTKEDANKTRKRRAEVAEAKLPQLQKLKEKAREESRKRKELRLKTKAEEEKKSTKKGKLKK